MKRRTYLTLAAASSLSLAGCTDAQQTSSGKQNGDDDSSTSSNGETPTETPSDLPDIAGTDDDFEDLDAWEVAGGSLSADSTRSVVGSQSARLEVGKSDQNARLTKRFSEPRDLTDVVPGVALAADDTTVPWLRLVDVDGDSVEYRRGIAPDMPLMRYNFGVDTVAKGFDAAAVSEVHLQLWTAEGDRRTVWFDDFHFTPRPDTGKVMLQFDDNHVTDYTKALPILEEYGYPAVTFVNPGRVEAEMDGVTDPGGYPRVTLDQLHELRDAGWTVSNHCYNHPHLSQLDANAQEAEIVRGKEWLESNGFEDGARYFAYPHGDYDETTLELVEKHHDIGFGGGLPVQGYTTNTRLTSRIGEPSAERVETELERTAEMRGITKIFYHRLEGADLEAFETLVETLHEYESRGEIDVILPRDLEREFLF
ncbi:polysaccharide deacetylase family protein [Natronorubrum sp. JWXQ-INN-674]|uniref:Polysaccharide deacetylase family protein n=1 Tax=Natronorubrum halalkaliphilum TaxID=2691917 RepID=A0A6B0VRP3_9EURY|nr:polysaccharide deacetylase family protein [Natronorubrum halalkaliphilum]MXV64521.1 polysaccharide deacetylase family protein [Natronorubrum halalkaliphilum]